MNEKITITNNPWLVILFLSILISISCTANEMFPSAELVTPQENLPTSVSSTAISENTSTPIPTLSLTNTPSPIATPIPATSPVTPTNTPQASRTYHCDEVVDISLVDSNSGWAAVNCWASVGNRAPTTGFIYQMVNGNWQLVSEAPDIAGPYACYRGISAVSANEMWAVGLRDGAYICQATNWLLHYQEGQWQIVEIDYLFDSLSSWHLDGLHSIEMVDANHGWAGGKGLILRYENGEWSVDLELPVNNAFDNIFYNISMSSINEGWAWAWSRDGSAFYHYQENTWLRWMELTFDENTVVTGIDAINSGEAWAIGRTEDSGSRYIPRLWHYLDGNWVEVELPIEEGAPQSIKMLSSDEGWITGGMWNRDPFILHYVDGEWVSMPLPAQTTFFSVDAINSDNVWVGADRLYQFMPSDNWQSVDIVSIIK